MFSKAHVSRWSFLLFTMTVFASLNLYAVSAHGASVDKKAPVVSPNIPVPKAVIPVPTVKAPVPVTKPSVKLNDNTTKAISKPVAPSTAKIPIKEIKPQNVPRPVAASKPKPGPSAGAEITKAPKVPTPGVTKPTLPATGMVSGPGLDAKRLKEIGEIQRDILEQARAARELEEIQNGPSTLRKVQPGDSAAGNALEGRGIGAGDGVDAEKFAREGFFGRISGEDAQNILKNGGIGAPDDQPGSFSASPTIGGAVSNPGHASDTTVIKDEDGNVVSVTTSSTEEATDGSGDSMSTTTTTNADGSSLSSMRITNPKGQTVYLDYTHYDAAGNVTNDSYTHDPSRSTSGQPNRIGGGIAGGRDSQPNENAPGKYGNCNPVSGWGCKSKRANHMDMIAQPSKGEESTDTGTSYPIAGPAAVTNPDEFNTRGSGGGRSIGTGGEAVDPEEIVPVPGGIGLDEDMGAIESTGAFDSK